MPDPRSILRRGVVVCLLLAPLPFGSVQPAAVLCLELFACLLGAIALGVLCFDREARPPATVTRLLWVASIPALVGLLQLLPAPSSWARWLVPRTAAVRAEVAGAVPELVDGASAWSIAPADTFDASLRLVAYGLLGLATFVGLRGRRDFRPVAIAIVAGAVFQALYGASQYLSGTQAIFGYQKVHYLDSATGTFINRNHFAIFLCTALPFAYFLAAGETRRRRRSWTLRFLGTVRPARISLAMTAVAAFCIWLGLLLSYSRAALVAAAGVTLLLLPMIGAGRRSRRAVFGALFAAVALAMTVSATAPGERFLDAERDLTDPGGRLAVWRASFDLVPDHLLAGAGLGTFDSVFPSVQPPGLRHRYEHAHNEWLQMLIEGGLVVLLAALGTLALLVRGSPPAGTPLAVRAFHRAGLAAVLAVAAHGLVDFPARIPAVAVLVAVAMGVCAAARAESARAGRRAPLEV